MAVHHQPKAPMPSVKQVFDPIDLTDARRASGEAPGLIPPSTPAGDSAEVVARARRRHFSSADKRRILEAADRCTRPGEIGALMRLEGVYSSSLSTWRRPARGRRLVRPGAAKAWSEAAGQSRRDATDRAADSRA